MRGHLVLPLLPGSLSWFTNSNSKWMITLPAKLLLNKLFIDIIYSSLTLRMIVQIFSFNKDCSCSYKTTSWIGYRNDLCLHQLSLENHATLVFFLNQGDKLHCKGPYWLWEQECHWTTNLHIKNTKRALLKASFPPAIHGFCVCVCVVGGWGGGGRD